MLVLQSPQDAYFFEKPVPLLDADLVDLADEDARVFAGYLLALPEGVVLLHYHDHLLRH